MGDLFSSKTAKSLLKNKFVVIIGDSIQRGIYKDFVRFLQTDQLLDEHMLRTKMEESHCGDKLYEGNLLTNAKYYREVRQYQTDFHLVRFYFVTRCFSEYFKTVLADLVKDPEPDVVIMNSCLWDVSRYGQGGVITYQRNLQMTFHCLTQLLPPHCLIIWNLSLPIGQNMKGGFLTEGLQWLKKNIMFDVLQGNFFAAQVAQDYGVDVNDLHYLFQNLQHHRVSDGIHWNAVANRHITNTLLARISQMWGVPLPGQDSNGKYISPMERQKHNNSKYEYIRPRTTKLPWERYQEEDGESGNQNTEKSIEFSMSDLLDLDKELASVSTSYTGKEIRKEDLRQRELSKKKEAEPNKDTKKINIEELMNAEAPTDVPSFSLGLDAASLDIASILDASTVGAQNEKKKSAAPVEVPSFSLGLDAGSLDIASVLDAATVGTSAEKKDGAQEAPSFSLGLDAGSFDIASVLDAATVGTASEKKDKPAAATEAPSFSLGLDAGSFDIASVLDAATAGTSEKEQTKAASPTETPSFSLGLDDLAKSFNPEAGIMAALKEGLNEAKDQFQPYAGKDSSGAEKSKKKSKTKSDPYAR